MGGRPARVFLIGFSASGKSTYGRRWAQQLGVPFRDTDEWITEQSGLSPERWIRECGERAFRQVEAETIEAILQEEPPLLVALGGGSVTIPDLLPKLRQAGWLLWIDPPWPWLLARLRITPRPLLQARPETEWYELWQQRRTLYRLADLHWPPHLLPENYILLWLQNRLRSGLIAASEKSPSSA
jgi:shikimate kinase